MFSWSRKQSSSSGSPSSSSSSRRRRGSGADGSMDSSSRGGGGSGSRGRSPRLDRRNAAKRIDYEVGGAGASASVGASWSSSSSAEQQRSPGLRPSRSLDLAPGTDLRISGSAEGEVDELCRSLGLSGPEDFAIPIAAWEARKSRSNSDLLPRPRHAPSPPNDEVSPIARAVSAPNVQPTLSVPAPIPEESLHSSSTSTATESAEEPTVAAESPKVAPAVPVVPPVGGLPLPSPRRGGGEVGIRGARPPLLSPPPPITALAPPPVRRSVVADDMTGSAWDIVQSFAPSEERIELGGAHESADTHNVSDREDDEVDDGVAAVEGELKELRLGETFEGFTGTSSLSTTNDDDASSTTTEAMFIISPNGKFKRKIKSWMRGALLGSGSFGMVYEGISDEGAFFAVKEVSLLDQGSNAQQSILALEQEIALLSQFEHENIVQYYGTDKVINPKKMYGPSADIWSLGCTVLEMLTRQIPFPNVEWVCHTNAFFMIGRGEQPPIPNYLSKEAQDFIGQCVRVDPENRPSASQLLEHPFVNKPLRSSFDSSSPPAVRF
nr:unnamed protein product [Digitaria exilis]